ncbi:Pentatricopeptide repeat-containing protein [Quillaja saponaria]|uniref:Pentatricopeptide repeat-containing protein n=1 Tax=Quillaja saponaria TaxID=32244 RepID=A0AAD7VEV9_QUISA|nr:Pentatricopeptide repeat-containing protein [Quillaja saponaria]
MKKINYSSAEFALWIDLISKTKGVAAAENYFNHLPPSSKNQMPYGALFNCYCKEIMSDKAFALFKKIKELNYLSPLAFNNLMSLYMRMSQPERVPSLVDEMKQRNIPLSNVTCSIWMNSYASLNDIECVERVYEEINKEDNDKVELALNHLDAAVSEVKDDEWCPYQKNAFFGYFEMQRMLMVRKSFSAF